MCSVTYVTGTAGQALILKLNSRTKPYEGKRADDSLGYPQSHTGRTAPLGVGLGFIHILRHVLLVAGFPFLSHCHALRVGAGAQLDGWLAYYRVTELYHEPLDRLIRKQLRVGARYGRILSNAASEPFARTNDPLFDLLRHISMQKMTLAPLFDPTPTTEARPREPSGYHSTQGGDIRLSRNPDERGIYHELKLLLENLRQTAPVCPRSSRQAGGVLYGGCQAEVPRLVDHPLAKVRAAAMFRPCCAGYQRIW